MIKDFSLDTIDKCKTFNEELINGVFFDKQKDYSKIKALSSLLRIQIELIKIELQNDIDFIPENLPKLSIKIEK